MLLKEYKKSWNGLTTPALASSRALLCSPSDHAPGAGLNLASSPGSKEKGWWKRTKLLLQLLWITGASFFPMQGSMEDKWALNSGPESVILEGGKERSLSINSHCSLHCRADCPHERSLFSSKRQDLCPSTAPESTTQSQDSSSWSQYCQFLYLLARTVTVNFQTKF